MIKVEWLGLDQNKIQAFQRYEIQTCILNLNLQDVDLNINNVFLAENRIQTS